MCVALVFVFGLLWWLPDASGVVLVRGDGGVTPSAVTGFVCCC